MRFLIIVPIVIAVMIEVFVTKTISKDTLYIVAVLGCIYALLVEFYVTFNNKE